MSKKDNGITKEQYFYAASEYYRIQAEIIELENCDISIDEYAAKRSELSRSLYEKSDIMHEYCGTELVDSHDLLRYPNLPRDIAIRETLATKGLKSLGPSKLEDIQFVVSASLFAPVFLSVVEPNTYNLWKHLLYSVSIIPGAVCLILFLSKAVTYPIMKMVEKVSGEPLAVRERFLRRVKFYKIAACAASVIIGLMFYVVMSL